MIFFLLRPHSISQPFQYLFRLHRFWGPFPAWIPSCTTNIVCTPDVEITHWAKGKIMPRREGRWKRRRPIIFEPFHLPHSYGRACSHFAFNLMGRRHVHCQGDLWIVILIQIEEEAYLQTGNKKGQQAQKDGATLKSPNQTGQPWKKG